MTWVIALVGVKTEVAPIQKEIQLQTTKNTCLVKNYTTLLLVLSLK